MKRALALALAACAGCAAVLGFDDRTPRWCVDAGAAAVELGFLVFRARPEGPAGLPGWFIGFALDTKREPVLTAPPEGPGALVDHTVFDVTPPAIGEPVPLALTVSFDTGDFALDYGGRHVPTHSEHVKGLQGLGFLLTFGGSVAIPGAHVRLHYDNVIVGYDTECT